MWDFWLWRLCTPGGQDRGVPAALDDHVLLCMRKARDNYVIFFDYLDRSLISEKSRLDYC